MDVFYHRFNSNNIYSDKVSYNINNIQLKLKVKLSIDEHCFIINHVDDFYRPMDLKKTLILLYFKSLNINQKKELLLKLEKYMFLNL